MAPAYAVGPEVRRPDGVTVAIDRADPLGTLGHLVQEDLCLMEKRNEAHVLTAAVLCFPASWRLAEKIGRPLEAIHAPVPEYDPKLARRVQRLFDGVQPGRPLWRVNALRYADPALHQPRARVPRARRPICPICAPSGNACCACRERGPACSRSIPMCSPGTGPAEAGQPSMRAAMMAMAFW